MKIRQFLATAAFCIVLPVGSAAFAADPPKPPQIGRPIPAPGRRPVEAPTPEITRPAEAPKPLAKGDNGKPSVRRPGGQRPPGAAEGGVFPGRPPPPPPPMMPGALPPYVHIDYTSTQCEKVVTSGSKLRIPKALGATTPSSWFDDWNAATSEARRTDRPILVLFTGSDWCHWCKVLHKEVLDTSEFRKYAAKNLVLVYMDSPSKKALPRELKNTREMLSNLLGAGNGVPCTILLSPKCERWDEIGGYDKNYLKRVKSILKQHGYK